MKDITYTFDGRSAIYLVLEKMKISEPDIALLPEWICSSVLLPYKKRKIKLLFYKINLETFEINLNDIKSKLCDKVKIVHIVNYFNIKQDWSAINRELSDVIILEDNAYSLFDSEKQFLKRNGSFSIYSFRKVSKCLGGGGIVPHIKNNKIIQPFYLVELIRWVLPNRRSIFGNISHLLNKYFFKRLKFGKKDRGFQSDVIISKDSISLLSYLTFKYAIYFKLSTYSCAIPKTKKIVLEKLNAIESPFLSVIPHQRSSTIITLLIDKERDMLFSVLHSKRFPVLQWPDLSMENYVIISKDSTKSDYYKKMIQIYILPYLKIRVYSALIIEIEKFLKKIHD